MPIEINDNGEIIELPSAGNNHFFRSTEVTELISNKPSFVVRWGISILSLIAISLFAAAWFIRYPDIVVARGILNSINAPKEVITKANGKLIKLFVKENHPVAKNEILGFMESVADQRTVIDLSIMLDSISTSIDYNHTNQVINFLSVRFDSLGELQTGYQTFSQSLQQFTNYLQNGFYLQKKNMLIADLDYIQKLHAQLEQQQQLLIQDLSLADSTFRSQESLKNDRVISALDYRNEKSKLISKQMTLPQINTFIISNESQQHEKQKEIAELENQIHQQKTIFIQSLNTIKSQVEDWKKKYLLVAPTAGIVFFATFLQEGQELENGQLICYINPGNASYYAEIVIPQYNFGKIKIGQEVLLKLQAYPYQEFGSVKGKIEFISAVPTDSGYFAKLSLPDGLNTNYKKSIQYRSGLMAQAEIITADLRLAERFLNTLRKSTSR